MEITGTINQILVELIRAALDPAKEFVCEIKEKKAKRSLDANAYYWKLLHQYAEWSHQSYVHVHNDILEHYGQPELVDGKVQTVLLKDSIDYKELPYMHLKWTGDMITGDNYLCYLVYEVRKNSREYNTQEFSRIVDGLINTIIGSGAPIETMTPAELAALKGYAA